MSQIRRIKNMKIAKKEIAVVTSPLKKAMLADKTEVTWILGNRLSLSKTSERI